MKKAITLLFLLLGLVLGTAVSAQNSTEIVYLQDGSVLERRVYKDTMVEVVYLKDGSIIRGMIVEQIPNVSLKIKTADGSIFAYPMSEVVKITKEQVQHTGRSWNNGKAIVDLGYNFGVGDYESDKIELSASYGYQFNPYLFLGVGAALDFYTDGECTLPFFTHFRANFMNTRITPFGDVKLGYTVGELSGVYLTMGLGVRFVWTKKLAVNLRLEYSFQGDEFSADAFEGINHPPLRKDSQPFQGFGLKAGFEF